ncbi:hypothetical protein [Flavobacterium sp. BFFFF1]|uniref:hypothetical protein n=1 Tax=Flavobacterium sp. BFFFF1 TaxID=2015557 RepID=UPI0025BBC869|nr:hypothetical protein [Flavobacterium sp. BFFFF1]
MKNTALLFFALFMTSVCFAQTTGDAKVDEMIKKMKQQQQSNASITYTFKGKTYKDAAMTDTTKKGYYQVLSSLIADKTPDSTILISFMGTASGTHQFGEKNNGSIVMLNGSVYQMKGTVTIVIKGAKASGSFQGELYLVRQKNPKPDAKSSGKISGTFKI